MTALARPLFAAVLLVAACGTEAPVPDRPTWVDDVRPILQANCFHCHGASANLAKSNTRRWDVFDLKRQGYADLGLMETLEFTSAVDPAHNVQIRGLIEATDPTIRMPPPPALPLSARDIEVIEKWIGEYDEGKHSPNHKPTISWLQKPKRYQVLDGDGDQVLGQLDCGGTIVQVTRSGGLDLPAGAAPPCTATLFDGFDTTTATLK